MLAYTEALERALGDIVARAHGELALVRDQSAAVVAAAQANVAAVVAEAEVRLATVEARIAAVRDGKDGVDGLPGKDGLNGQDGLPGAPGAPGERGLDGAPGRDGADGKDGLDGAIGRDGLNGIDGKDGAPGERGPEGPAGKLGIVRAWADRVHYEGDVVFHAGSSWQALKDTGREPPDADWQMIASAGARGADGRTFEHRGTWAEDATYRALDVVMLNGSSFVATLDEPGACPGEGWRLIASKGSRGAPGERGPQGDAGPRGYPGASIVEMSIDENGMLSALNSDGSLVQCDLYPVLVRLK